MSSSIHIDNKKKDVLVLRRGPTQGLESTLTAEKMYSINFTVIDKGVCDRGYVWIPSNCEFECDKSCNIGEYLDYSSYNCKKG